MRWHLSEEGRELAIHRSRTHAHMTWSESSASVKVRAPGSLLGPPPTVVATLESRECKPTSRSKSQAVKLSLRIEIPPCSWNASRSHLPGPSTVPCHFRIKLDLRTILTAAEVTTCAHKCLHPNLHKAQQANEN